jgi:hypothetical protein
MERRDSSRAVLTGRDFDEQKCTHVQQYSRKNNTDRYFAGILLGTSLITCSNSLLKSNKEYY